MFDRETALDALEDLTQAADYALVGPQDNRVHEIRTTRFPFNTICYLGRDFGDGVSRGCTGVLIAPQIVLTAGHCVYNHQRGKAPTRIAVIPGRADRKTKPYGSITSKQYYAHRNFLHPRSGTSDLRDFDYGIILLPQVFTTIRKFMVLHVPKDQELERLRHRTLVTIAGYPGDRPLGTLWRHAERLKKVTTRRLFYTVDTCPGHSGSPIWYQSQGSKKLFLIGVHTSGITDELGRPYGCRKDTVLAPPGMMNSGVRLTPEVLANIRAPLRQAAAATLMVPLP